jgi:pimeloyl-ACP methyl ester carboxylesterase
MPAAFPVTEHVAKTARHTTFYLACGAVDAPAIIFVHGWPELSASWRHQLPVFAALGCRAIAPDMGGYGRPSVYSGSRHRTESGFTLSGTGCIGRSKTRPLGGGKAGHCGGHWPRSESGEMLVCPGA